LTRKFLLVFAGMLAGLLIFELSVRILKGSPKSNEIKSMYLEIYDDFFKLDSRNQSLTNIRSGSKRSSFPLRRSNNEKLVFIAGESVAYENEDEYLQRYFEKVFPEFKWHIVNVGCCGYDAYRINLVIHDIIRYKPDLLILMMGNNPPLSPARITVLPYRNKYLSLFWAPRIIAKVLFPDIVISKNYFVSYFEKYFNDICVTATAQNIPVAACVLPQNNRTPQNELVFRSWYSQDELFFRKLSFAFWWLLYRDPERITHSGITHSLRVDEWLLAKYYEKVGRKKEADICFKSRPLNKEIRIIRDVAARCPGVITVDFAARIEQFDPGYNFFIDRCHYWPPGYQLLADEIFKSLYAHRSSIGLPADEYRWKRYWDNVLSDKKVEGDIRQYKYIFCKMQGVDSLRYFAHWPQTLAGLESYKNIWQTDKQGCEDVLKCALASKDMETRRRGAAVSLLLGEILREKSCYAQAFKCFENSRQKDMNTSDLYFFRGLCYYDIKDDMRADNDFRLLALLDSGFKWLNCGYLHSIEKYFLK